MEQQKVDMFIMTNQKYFPAEKIMYLKEKLMCMDDAKFSMVSTIELKDPTTLLLISLFLGGLGVDRFMIGDTGMGILKLLTCGMTRAMLSLLHFDIKEYINNNPMAFFMVTTVLLVIHRKFFKKKLLIDVYAAITLTANTLYYIFTVLL